MFICICIYVCECFICFSLVVLFCVYVVVCASVPFWVFLCILCFSLYFKLHLILYYGCFLCINDCKALKNLY